MDGANFISKVVNNLTDTPAQGQQDMQAAAQAGLPEALQDGAAPFIAGLSVQQVEEIYHTIVRAREDRLADDADGVSRVLLANDATGVAAPAGAQIDLEISNVIDTSFGRLTGLTNVSANALVAAGALGHADGPPSGQMFVPNDTLYGNQWHLNQTVAGRFDLGDLQTIWDEYDGSGVTVTVADTGMDRSHEDLVGNFDFSRDWDFVDNDGIAEAVNANENHATAVAGIISSVGNNSLGTTGIAYGSDLSAFRVEFFINNDMIDDFTGVANYASGLGGSGNYQADIVNMSYGSMYAGNFFDEALGSSNMANLNAAFDSGVVSGRGGLGTIYVKSAGNSRNTSDSSGNVGHDANASSWNANIHTISVAAVDQNGFVSSYSTPGANILISGFGTPGQVWTTDREGTDGYSSGNYTGGFNGTSAAAPMVSGVIALMLDANSSLGWRDVQEILAYSARHVGSAVDGSTTAGSEKYAWDFNGANDWNGGGLHFSNDYGFGLVDAFAAVRLAEVWTIGTSAQTSSNDTVTFNDVLNATQTLTGSNAANNYVFTPSTNIEIEHVTVDINFVAWDDLGDLDIVLIAPDGTEVHLINNIGENDGSSADGFTGRWEFTSPALMGMNSTGSWTLVLRDQDSSVASPITINDIDIRFLGAGADNEETFIFTNEYSDYASGPSHGTNFAGGAGVDTINTVAVTSNTTVNLQTNSGTIDGVAITNSLIERVFTGDGNDTIVGDAFSTHLYGGRGNDTISVLGTGTQTQRLYGGAGVDTLEGRNGLDYLYGGDGNDRLNNSAGGDRLYGGVGGDTFWFDAGETIATGTILYGGSGDDRIMLSGAGTFDLSGDFESSFIEEIEFRGDGSNVSKTLLLGSDELNNAGELGDALIDGNGNTNSDDNIIISTGVENVVDLSGWTFQNWQDIDTITINGNNAANTLTGSSEADTINGGNGIDTLYGGAGNDILDGGAGGTDDVYGGTGDDMFLYTSGHGYDNFYGGTGTDMLDMSGDMSVNHEFNFDLNNYGITGFAFRADLLSIESVIGTAGDNAFNAAFLGTRTLDGGAGVDTINLSSNAANISANQRVFDIDQGYSFNGGAFQGSWSNMENLTIFANVAGTVIGNSANNTLTGSSYGDIIYGESGADTLYGGAGDDEIFGGTGTGANLVYGGVGDDVITSSGYGTYYGGADDDLLLAGSGGAETLDGGSGIDTLDTTSWNSTYNIDMNTGVTNYGGESFVGFENIILGNGTNSVTGTSGANMIMGGTGSDTVNDGSGGDTVVLGDGDDRLIMGDASIGGDSYNGGNGVDTFDASARSWAVDVTIDLNAGVWSYAAGSEAVINFENIEGANNNTGTIETLIGTNGVNVINGHGGNDDIDGRGGNDVLNGGGGNDFINAGGGNDTVIGGSGKDELIGGGGNDRLFGGDGNDIVRGGVGADFMSGGTGSDTLSYTADTAGVNVNLTANTASGGNATGDTIASFESVKGGSGDNILIGTISNNAIISRGGNDSLYGLDGDDRIAGGGGDDLIRGDGGADTLNGGGGTDTLSYGTDSTGVNVDIGLNTASGGDAAGDIISRFENLTGGTGDDILKGTGGDNVIKGGAGADRLSGRTGDDELIGGAGTDTLNGGEGNDTLTGGGAADVFIFNGPSDDDTITDFQVGIDTLKIYGLTSANVAFSNAGGGDTLVTLSTGDTILVENTSIGQLNTFSDFDFV